MFCEARSEAGCLFFILGSEIFFIPQLVEDPLVFAGMWAYPEGISAIHYFL
jgi:hypothetical protein